MVPWWQLIFAWVCEAVLLACVIFLAQSSKRLRRIIDIQAELLEKGADLLTVAASRERRHRAPDPASMRAALEEEWALMDQLLEQWTLDASDDGERQGDDGQDDEHGEQGGVHGS